MTKKNTFSRVNFLVIAVILHYVEDFERILQQLNSLYQTCPDYCCDCRYPTNFKISFWNQTNKHFCSDFVSHITFPGHKLLQVIN